SEHIFQSTHPDLASEFPPLPSLDALPNNLPEPVTSFIGREREMAEVQRLLESTRLLTVTGPGGTGKTRLALQVAAAIAAGPVPGADLLVGAGPRARPFPDGVLVVELAWLSDPALVPQAAAATLGVREAIAVELRGERLPVEWAETRAESRSLTHRLVEHLRSRQLLVVLDNCEHLVGACAELAEL